MKEILSFLTFFGILRLLVLTMTCFCACFLCFPFSLPHLSYLYRSFCFLSHVCVTGAAHLHHQYHFPFSIDSYVCSCVSPIVFFLYNHCAAAAPSFLVSSSFSSILVQHLFVWRKFGWNKLRVCVCVCFIIALFSVHFPLSYLFKIKIKSNFHFSVFLCCGGLCLFIIKLKYMLLFVCLYHGPALTTMIRLLVVVVVVKL